jgi:L-amino acid N-acyltransferase YncA
MDIVVTSQNNIATIPNEHFSDRSAKIPVLPDMGDDMEYFIRKANDADAQNVADIYNYYAQNSFAAFPEKTITKEFYFNFRELTRGDSFYVVETPIKELIGFALIRHYQKMFGVFDSVAELTYFILPQHTRTGLGSQLLEILIADAGKMQIKSLLSEITSVNSASINFHLKKGFVECGRFKNVGKKFEQIFDVIWMQKFI